MPSRKKQKTAQQQRTDPLGSRFSHQAANAEPSEEELALATSLFGANADMPITSKASTSVIGRLGGLSRLNADESVEKTGLEDVDDDELFALDIGSGADESDGEDGSEIEAESPSDLDSSVEDDGHDDEEVHVQQDPEAGPSRLSPAADEQPNLQRRRPVWTDPSTSSMLIPLVGPHARAPDASFAGTKRLRKLRSSREEMELSGKEYERRLRDMYEKLHPRPSWASRSALASVATQEQTLAQQLTKKASITISSGTTLADLLSRDAGLVARATGHRSQGRLTSGSIELERLRDASHGLDSDLSSAVECMEFHPSARAKILMTASRDRRVRLFQIDGSSNPLLQTLHVPTLPITNAAFHPMGSSILLSGPRPYLYSYDLQAGRVLRSSPWRAASGSGLLNEEDHKERDLSRARFQPLDGSGASRLLAVGGRRGAVHLLDWSTSGGAGGSLVGSLRQNSALAGLDWDTSSGAEGRRLVSLSQEGTMSVWDVRNSKCEVIKRDVGLFGATGLRLGPDGSWCSVGSESGIVNMYSMEQLLSQKTSATATSNQLVETNIEANKSIGNLTTTTTTMRYNHDGQILALASQNKKDALRMLHLPSLTVFSNWPTSGTPLGHVSDVAFSSHGSQYVAIGNTRGRVLLYGLRHFAS